MNTPTNAEIRERHDKAIERADAFDEELPQAHIDRGILLDRLERKDEIIATAQGRARDFQDRLVEAQRKLDISNTSNDILIEDVEKLRPQLEAAEATIKKVRELVNEYIMPVVDGEDIGWIGGKHDLATDISALIGDKE